MPEEREKIIYKQQIMEPLEAVTAQIAKALPASFGIANSIKAAVLKNVGAVITWDDLTTNLTEAGNALDNATINTPAQSAVQSMLSKFSGRIYEIALKNLEATADNSNTAASVTRSLKGRKNVHIIPRQPAETSQTI